MKNYAIDILKIVLMLQVVVGHYLALFTPGLRSGQIDYIYDFWLIILKILFWFGRESAYVFIMISGYLTNIFYRGDGGEKFWFFLTKRFNKLYPMFFIGLLSTAIFDYFGMKIDADVYIKNNLNYNVYARFDFETFLGNVFLLQPQIFHTFGSNGPLWTIGYLIQFYIIAIFIVKASKNNFRNGLLINLAVSGIFFAVGWYEAALCYFIWCFGGYANKFEINTKIFKRKYIKYLIAFVILLIARVSSWYISAILSSILGCFYLMAYRGFNFNGANGVRISINIISRRLMPVYVLHMPVIFFMLALSSWCDNNSVIILLFMCVLFLMVELSMVFENFWKERSHA